jgi:predicted phage gp36 major capsid-like protein
MSSEYELERITTSCDVARRKVHRVEERMQESRDQSSKLQVEMREDVERLEDQLREANEQVLELKSQLGRAKEAAVAIKTRDDRQVAQLGIEKEGTVVAIRELRNSVAELNALGVEQREQIATLTGEKQ